MAKFLKKSPSFIGEFNRIKKVFTDAIESAEKLNYQMDSSIASSREEILVIEAEIAQTESIKSQNEAFIKNLSNLVK